MSGLLNKLLPLVLLSALNLSSAAYFYRDTKYEIAYDCARNENCWHFLNPYIVEMLHAHQDTDQNPCEDFFEYANGNFYSSLQDKSFLELVDAHYTEAVIDTLNILNGRQKPGDKNDDIYNLQHAINDFLFQCKRNQDVDRSPILEGLDKARNLSWPNWKQCFEALEWNEPMVNWTKLLGELRNFGLNNVFFKEHVTVAYNDANELLVELQMPIESEPFDEYDRLNFVWHNITDYNNPEARKLMVEIEELTKLISVLSAKHHTEIGGIEEKQILTLAELKQQIPLINWQTYFEALLQRSFSADTLKIQLRNPKYIKDLATLIDQTEERTVAFYIFLRFVDFYHSITPHFAYANCKEDAVKLFSFGTNYLYQRFVENDLEKKRQLLEAMFEDLKSKFASKLQNNKMQLKPTELEFLQQKLKGLKLRIGNTPLEMPARFFDAFYVQTDLELPYVENLRNLKRFLVKNSHNKLFESPTAADLEYFFAYDDTVEPAFEPYFVPQRNLVIVPQQFLSVPYFSRGMEKVFQYSTTGFGLARAIMSAFSADGIIFDADGNENLIGKGIKLLPAYQIAFNCLRNVSEHFTRDRMPDIMGFRLVLDTYYDLLPTTGDNATLTIEAEKLKISFNMRQLFFQHFAQYFGGSHKSQAEYITEFDTPEARLLAIVSQAPEFAQFYECAAKSPNENTICELW